MSGTDRRPDELATDNEYFTGDAWRIVSLPSWFRTSGEKRIASAELFSPDVGAYWVWDDVSSRTRKLTGWTW